MLEFKCKQALVNFKVLGILTLNFGLHSRSSGISGSSSRSSSSLAARRTARLQRCLGRVLPPASSILRHTQSSIHGCSTTSPPGTSPLKICPPHEEHCLFLLLQLPSQQVWQGSSERSNFRHKTFFSPYTGLKLSLLFLLLTCNVCFMYFFAQGQ